MCPDGNGVADKLPIRDIACFGVLLLYAGGLPGKTRVENFRYAGLANSIAACPNTRGTLNNVVPGLADRQIDT